LGRLKFELAKVEFKKVADLGGRLATFGPELALQNLVHF
jgi:hypothetical protein